MGGLVEGSNGVGGLSSACWVRALYTATPSLPLHGLKHPQAALTVPVTVVSHVVILNKVVACKEKGGHATGDAGTKGSAQFDALGTETGLRVAWALAGTARNCTRLPAYKPRCQLSAHHMRRGSGSRPAS